MKRNDTTRIIILCLIGIVGGCVWVQNSTDVTIDQNKQDKPNIDLSTFKREAKQDTLQIDSLK